jgi:hypothetical protein
MYKSRRNFKPIKPDKMKSSIRLLLPAIVAIALCTILPAAANAQACSKGCDVGGPSAPLDGGISILLAAGLGLGIKKALKNKKADQEDEKSTVG